MLRSSPFYLILGISDSLIIELSKLGFKFDRKRLYVFILFIPYAIVKYMHARDAVVFDDFATNKSELTADHRAGIDSLTTYIIRTWNGNQSLDLFRPVKDLLIIGHTDQVGTEEKNSALGRRRAETIKRYISREIPHSLRHLVKIDSYGESYPRFHTAQEANPYNRRVEVRITYHEFPFDTLKQIEESILKLVENDKDSGMYEAIKCIGKAVTQHAIDDRYFGFENEYKRFSPNLRLRTGLLIWKYRENSDEKIYEFLEEQIGIMYRTAHYLEKEHSYGENNENIRARDFVRLRLELIPSIWKCTKIE